MSAARCPFVAWRGTAATSSTLKAETTDLLMRLNLLSSGVTRDKAADLSLDLLCGDDPERQRLGQAQSIAAVVPRRNAPPSGVTRRTRGPDGWFWSARPEMPTH